MSEHDIPSSSKPAATWIDIGPVAAIPLQGSRIVRTDFGDIAVFRTQDDQLFALRDRCPHKGGPLSAGLVHGKRVTCPLHNWVLELQSGEAVAPDVGCARTYGVMVEAGRVYLGPPTK